MRVGQRGSDTAGCGTTTMLVNEQSGLYEFWFIEPTVVYRVFGN